MAWGTLLNFSVPVTSSKEWRLIILSVIDESIQGRCLKWYLCSIQEMLTVIINHLICLTRAPESAMTWLEGPINAYSGLNDYWPTTGFSIWWFLGSNNNTEKQKDAERRQQAYVVNVYFCVTNYHNSNSLKNKKLLSHNFHESEVWAQLSSLLRVSQGWNQGAGQDAVLMWGLGVLLVVGRIHFFFTLSIWSLPSSSQQQQVKSFSNVNSLPFLPLLLRAHMVLLDPSG